MHTNNDSKKFQEFQDCTGQKYIEDLDFNLKTGDFFKLCKHILRHCLTVIISQ